MRILYLSSVRIPSEKASGLAIARQCEGFALNGHDVVLHVPKRTKHIESLADAYGMKPNFTIVHFSSFPLFFLGKPGLFILYCYETFRVVLYYFLQRGKFDVIYARDQYRLLPFVLFGQTKKCISELHTIHGNFFTKLVAKKSKTVVVISQGLQRFYSELTGRKDILVEPSGVYLDQFEGLPNEILIRDEIFIPKDAVVFGYVGKFKTIGMSKGVEEIIEAFAMAFRNNPNTFLLLVGAEINENEEFSKMCNKFKIPEQRYKILPLNQSMFAQYLVACDVLMMNYPNGEHYANYMSPIKMFAYLAVGKPIISSDLPTIREIEGVKGIVYAEPDSTMSYANTMKSVLANINCLKQQSLSNIELAKQFSWPARSERILKN